MRVGLLLTEIPADPTPDELDVLQQCDAVESALRDLGHETVRLSCGLNLGDTIQELRRLLPDVVFNLVESIDRTDRLMPIATLMLESLSIPYTGASSHAILTTTGKLTAKRWMQQQKLPTPAWTISTDKNWQGIRPELVILKAVWEHASFGMDDSAVVDCRNLSDDALRELLTSREERTGKAFFAEQFIDGREFNLTLLQGASGPLVLPAAEIQFVDFPANKPRIVGYAAKWDDQSAEYHNTPRTFDFDPDDEPLLTMLRELAERCWRQFDLCGYARVDFRVDRQGRPWILEINANPCLSPDAGFAAAVTQAGLEFPEAIRLILEAALNRR